MKKAFNLDFCAFLKLSCSNLVVIEFGLDNTFLQGLIDNPSPGGVEYRVLTITIWNSVQDHLKLVGRSPVCIGSQTYFLML